MSTHTVRAEMEPKTVLGSWMGDGSDPGEREGWREV